MIRFDISLYYFFILIIYHRHISTYYNICNIIYFLGEVKGFLTRLRRTSRRDAEVGERERQCRFFYNKEVCLSRQRRGSPVADRLSISLYGNVRVVGVRQRRIHRGGKNTNNQRLTRETCKNISKKFRKCG